MNSSVKDIFMGRISFLATIGLVCVASAVQGSENKVSGVKGLSAISREPLYFEENAGQLEGAGQFVARGTECSVLLTRTEADIVLGKSQDKTAPFEHAVPRMLRLQLVDANAAAGISGRDRMPARANYFIGNEPSKWHVGVPLFSRVQVDDVYPGVQVVYYANNSAQLEYDFHVQPEAQLGRIRLHVEGADKVEVDHTGNLVLKIGDEEITQHKPIAYQESGGARKEIEASYRLESDGTVGFALGKYDRSLPLIIDPALDFLTYIGGKKEDIAWAVALDAQTNIYVAGETLSIDLPTTNAIVFTNATGVQIFTNFQGGKGAAGDAFVAKYDNSGALQFLTYLGGKTDDGAISLTVDPTDGNVWLTGFTDSTNFPLVNPIRTKLTGPNNNAKHLFPVDAFLVKLDQTGANLLFSSYFGGANIDEGFGITTDPSGGIYVTGLTSSTNLLSTNQLLTSAAFQTNWMGDFDAFVAKFTNATPATPALNIYTNAYTTYIGGSNVDYGLGIAVDNANHAWITGITFSTNFPVSTNVLGQLTNQFPGHLFTDLNAQTNSPKHNTSFRSDAFVAEFDTDGSRLFSAYLGGTNDDAGTGITVDPSGNNVYVTGYTFSPDFPTTVVTVATNQFFPPGTTNIAFPNAATNFTSHVFVTEITNGGVPADTAFAYSTQFGGNRVDQSTGIAVDSGGNAYVTGSTTSTNFFVTNLLVFTNAIPITNKHGIPTGLTNYLGFITNNSTFTNLSSTNITVKFHSAGNTNDVFVAVLSPGGSNFVHSILLGGPGDDDANSIAIDPGGTTVYIVGLTTSRTNFATTNAAQRIFGNGKSSRLTDGFAAKIELGP